MSALAPFVNTYATETPYITEAEFRAAPTALDLNDLIDGGNTAQQSRAITDTILRASSWVNELAKQILACTVDVERDTYRIDRRGYVRVPLRYKPVLEVTGVRVGTKPSQMVTLTDFTDVVVRKYSVDIPVFPLSIPAATQLSGGWAIGSQVLVDTTYINGWVASLLAAGTTAGASSLTLNQALGVYAGSAYRISDGVNTEDFIVASSYVAGSTTVPTVTPLQYAHASGVFVGNLPARAKEATILLTTVLIQTRGNDAIVLESLENPSRLQSAYGSSGENVAMAADMLKTLTRVW